MPKITNLSILTLLLGVLSACSQQKEPLIVYAGKGLKFPIEEIRTRFEQQEGVSVSINYAGSETLLSTIKKTRKGDVFIPGSRVYIQEAGDLEIAINEIIYH